VLAQEISRTPGFEAEDVDEATLQLWRGVAGIVAVSWLAPNRLDPCPLVVSGEKTIDPLFRIPMEGFLEGRDSMVWEFGHACQ